MNGALELVLAYLNRAPCAFGIHTDRPVHLSFREHVEGWIGVRCLRCGRRR